MATHAYSVFLPCFALNRRRRLAASLLGYARVADVLQFQWTTKDEIAIKYGSVLRLRKQAPGYCTCFMACCSLAFLRWLQPGLIMACTLPDFNTRSKGNGGEVALYRRNGNTLPPSQARSMAHRRSRAH